MNRREWDKRMGSKVNNYIQCNIKMSEEMERNDCLFEHGEERRT